MTGNISHIQRFSVGDGPGIRSTVFFKGCPLHCPWCHNPETIPSERLLVYHRSVCTACGKCKSVCANGVHIFDEANHEVLFSKCVKCGKCIDTCPNNALEINGKEMSVNDVMSVVMQDKDFYAASEGGITLSGGEPLYQPEFCEALAKACHDNGISVLIDTSGTVEMSVLEAVMPYADEYYVDLKAANEADYMKLTGASLKNVLENIKLLCEANKKVTVRIPVIPGHNDSIEYMRKMAEVLKGTDVKNVDLLPFHSLCVSKYTSIGRKYKYAEYGSLTKADIEPLLDAFEGFSARITN